MGQGGCHLAGWVVFLAGAGAPTVKRVGQVGFCRDAGIAFLAHSRLSRGFNRRFKGVPLGWWLAFLAGAGAPTVKRVGQVGSCRDSGITFLAHSRLSHGFNRGFKGLVAT